jgi:hypothetical protein
MRNCQLRQCWRRIGNRRGFCLPVAVDPAEVTNSATFVVETTVRASLRNGLADPALVKMMSGCRSSGIANAPAAPDVSAEVILHRLHLQTRL